MWNQGPVISRRGWRLGYRHVSPSVFGSRDPGSESAQETQIRPPNPSGHRLQSRLPWGRAAAPLHPGLDRRGSLLSSCQFWNLCLIQHSAALKGSSLWWKCHQSCPQSQVPTGTWPLDCCLCKLTLPRLAQGAAAPAHALAASFQVPSLLAVLIEFFHFLMSASSLVAALCLGQHLLSPLTTCQPSPSFLVQMNSFAFT